MDKYVLTLSVIIEANSVEDAEYQIATQLEQDQTTTFYDGTVEITGRCPVVTWGLITPPRRQIVQNRNGS